jgi:hypothetical protein
MADMKLRFSIRDLLWLAVVAALIDGWWVDHWNSTYCRNRYTLETVSAGEPQLIRDNVTRDVLLKDGDVWRVGHEIPGVTRP